MTLWEQIKVAISHNRGLVAAIVIAVLAAGCVYGMASKVPSLQFPDKKVTRAELQAEMEYSLSQYEIKFADLDQQDAFKAAIANAAIDYATTGGINPLGLILTLTGTLGFAGVAADNMRKDAVIRNKDNQLAMAAPVTPTA